MSAVMLEGIAANSFFDKSGAIGVDTAMTDSLSLSDSSPSHLLPFFLQQSPGDAWFMIDSSYQRSSANSVAGS